jgi:hypothetical protein
MNFGARREKRSVNGRADGAVQRFPETGPSSAAVVFRFRIEERVRASRTDEKPLAFFMIERTRAWLFSAMLAKNPIGVNWQ